MQAWIEGFKFDHYWQNTTNCLDLIANVTFVQKSLVEEAMRMPNDEINAAEKARNVTKLI